jgi:uncharacterized protein YjbI with pentapeptide repeats
MSSLDRLLRPIRRTRRNRDLARTPKLGSLPLLGAGAVVGAILGAAVLYVLLASLLGVDWHLNPPGVGQPNPPIADQQKLLADLVKVALGLAAGIGAAFALVVGYRRARVEEASSHRDDRRLFSSRYQDAADLIGSEKPAVRLAGIYAMARLADDWEEQQQQCIDVLCAYLRLPYDPGASTAPPSRARRLNDRRATPAPPAPPPSGEREVRLTVIRLIADHLQPEALHPWHGRNFDFTEAVFDGGDFTGATFSGGTVRFLRATFSSGAVSFRRATFSGGVIDFRGVRFSGGRVSFYGSAFYGGTVDFHSAIFSGGTVDFEDAAFAGGTVDFDNARFYGGTVDFSGATFSKSRVGFSDGTFSDGSRVKFSQATFSGGRVSFNRGGFAGGYVDFGGAAFSGAIVDFGKAEFVSSAVSFVQATFDGGEVYFVEATFTGGEISFYVADFAGATVDFMEAEMYGGELDLSGAFLVEPDGMAPLNLPETSGGSLKLPPWITASSPDKFQAQ